MFERFDKEAVRAVHVAVASAETADTINTEHLLLGLFQAGGPDVARLTAGITGDDVQAALARAHRRGGVSATEADSLRDLGIDVDAMVSQVEDQLGQDALTPAKPKGRKRRHRPFDTGAKRCLAGAIDEAREERERRIGSRHLLLSILRHGGLASSVLNDLGVTYQDARARMS